MRTKAKVISATKEDYVRAIYLLQEFKKSTGVTDIAGRLHLSKSTVSERIKELKVEGLVLADLYGAVSLTKVGVDVGKKLTYKHRIIEVFLSEVLKLPKGLVHDEAEKLEHACSDAVIKRLAIFLKHPKTDPHGTPIPKITNWNC